MPDRASVRLTLAKKHRMSYDAEQSAASTRDFAVHVLLQARRRQREGGHVVHNHGFELLVNYDLSDPPRSHCRPIERDYFDWVMEAVSANDATILWRTNLAGRAYFHSRHMAAFDHSCVVGPLADDWHRVADVLEKYDPLEEAVRAARKHGARIFAYMPMNEFVCYRNKGLNLIDPI